MKAFVFTKFKSGRFTQITLGRAGAMRLDAAAGGSGAAWRAGHGRGRWSKTQGGGSLASSGRDDAAGVRAIPYAEIATAQHRDRLRISVAAAHDDGPVTRIAIRGVPHWFVAMRDIKLEFGAYGAPGTRRIRLAKGAWLAGAPRLCLGPPYARLRALNRPSRHEAHAAGEDGGRAKWLALRRALRVERLLT